MIDHPYLRNGLLTAACAFALLVAGCTSVRTADPPQARAQIEQRLHEVLTAAESKDFDRLESCHLYGPKFTRYSGTSAQRLDAAATRQLEHDGLVSLRGLKLQVEDLKIDVFGEVGIATGILISTYEVEGKTVGSSNRSTLVFVREHGAWKIAHEHLSPVNVPPVQSERGGQGADKLRTR